MDDSFRCGFVAFSGKPNTGKSTLMNALVGEKISITAQRPQTTRHQVLGIRTTDKMQCIFVDTPGIHQSRKKAINRYMNRAATSVVNDVDLVCILVDAGNFNRDDTRIFKTLAALPHKIIVLNKIDRFEKNQLLPVMQQIHDQMPGTDIIPVSALKQENLDYLMQQIERYLPESPPQFPDDQITDRSMRFMVEELIREKLFRSLTQELPYSLTVKVEHYQEEEDILRIAASVWVERSSQKGIVIGKNGGLLKKVGSEARQDIQELSGKKVYLQLWAKVREDWSDDERALESFGYRESE